MYILFDLHILYSNDYNDIFNNIILNSSAIHVIEWTNPQNINRYYFLFFNQLKLNNYLIVGWCEKSTTHRHTIRNSNAAKTMRYLLFLYYRTFCVNIIYTHHSTVYVTFQHSHQVT